jgi:hypothetical protein
MPGSSRGRGPMGRRPGVLAKTRNYGFLCWKWERGRWDAQLREGGTASEAASGLAIRGGRPVIWQEVAGGGRLARVSRCSRSRAPCSRWILDTTQGVLSWVPRRVTGAANLSGLAVSSRTKQHPSSSDAA